MNGKFDKETITRGVLFKGTFVVKRKFGEIFKLRKLYNQTTEIKIKLVMYNIELIPKPNFFLNQ